MLRWVQAALGAVLIAAAGVPAVGEALQVVVIVDNSGSMQSPMRGGGNRIEAAKQSLLSVLEQTPDDAMVGVLALNPVRGEHWIVPLGPVDRQATREAVNRLSALGPTPLGAAMKRGADALLESRSSSRYGTYKLLVVTDGEATDGDLVQRYLPEVLARGLLVDTIGVAMGSQHSLATRSNTYRSADDPESLQQAISAVVLGESAADGGSAGESDFEWLEGFPAEVAAASLTALSQPANTPVGATAAAPNSGNARRPPVGSAPQQTPQPAPEGGGGFPVRLAVVAVIVFIVLKAVTGAAKGR